MLSCFKEGRQDAMPELEPNLNVKEIEKAALSFLEDELGNTSSASSFFRRAKYKFASKDISGAMEDVQMALKKDPENPEYLTLLGQIYVEKAEWERAKEALSLAESVGERSTELMLAQAEVLSRLKEAEEAEVYLQSAALKDPFSATTWRVAGLVKASLGDTMAAIANLDKSIALNPFDVEVYRLMSDYLSKIDIDSALSVNQLCVERNGNSILLKEDKAGFLVKAGMPSRAIETYLGILKESPQRYDLMTVVGNIYFRKKEYYGALNMYKKVLEKLPSNPNIYYLVGNCYEKIGSYSLAQDHYASAMVKNSAENRYANAYKRAGYLLERQIANRVNPKVKKKEDEEEAPIERKVFKVEPLRNKSEIKQ